MDNTTATTTTTGIGRFTLVKNFDTGFWELTTPNPKITYILSPPTEDWVNVVYLIGLCIARYRGLNEVVGDPTPLPQSIRDVVGIKQLIGGW